MSGDSSSDDGQGEEYLENDWCSAAGGKDKRVVVVNGIALPKCRSGFVSEGLWGVRAVRTMHVRVCRGNSGGEMERRFFS